MPNDGDGGTPERRGSMITATRHDIPLGIDLCWTRDSRCAPVHRVLKVTGIDGVGNVRVLAYGRF